MKRNNVLVILAVLSVTLSFIVTACKKDDNNNNSASVNPPAATAVMKAKVDGVSWESISSRAGGGIINNTSNLTGIATDSSNITMTVTEAIVLGGSYDLGFGSGNAGVFNPTNGGVVPAWSSNGEPTCTGSITITSMDTVNKKMGGTFSFKAWRASDNTFRNVTLGEFSNVPYVTSLSGGGSNSFTIKANNVTFTPAVVTGIDMGTQINIIASDNQGVISAGLIFPNTIVPGTYSMQQFGTYYGTYNDAAANYCMSVSGSLVITAHNTTAKTISGTCSYVAQPFGSSTPSYNMTAGAFSVTYQ